MAEKPLINLTNIDNNMDTMKTNISTLKTNLTSLQGKSHQLIYDNSVTKVTSLTANVSISGYILYEIIFAGSFNYSDLTTVCNMTLKPNGDNSYSNSQATFFEFTGSGINNVNVSPEPNLRIARGRSGVHLIARTLLCYISNNTLVTQTVYSAANQYDASYSMTGMISTNRLCFVSPITSLQFGVMQSGSTFSGRISIHRLN